MKRVTVSKILELTPSFRESGSRGKTKFPWSWHFWSGGGICVNIGTERAELFLQDAWREFLNDFSARQTAVMTLRWVDKDGQPDLICEEASGGRITSTMPVRYATYPAFPILKLYSYGWEEMARSMNFQLPPSFKTQN